MYVCLSFSQCLCVSLAGCPRQFLEIIKLWPVIARSACSCRPQVMQYNLYSSTVSPHWGPKDPSGVQLGLYVRLYVSLYGLPHRFLVIIPAVCNCVQCMWMQATGSNPLSGIRICPSAHPSVRLSVRLFICPSICPSAGLLLFLYL